MPRATNPYRYTNWTSAPILNWLEGKVHKHFLDASQGDRANQTIIQPGLEELADTCIQALADLGMSAEDVLAAVSRVYEP